MIAFISIRNILRTRCWHGLLSYFTFNHSHIHFLSFFKCLTLSKYCSPFTPFLLLSFTFFCILLCCWMFSVLLPSGPCPVCSHLWRRPECVQARRESRIISLPTQKKNIWISQFFSRLVLPTTLPWSAWSPHTLGGVKILKLDASTDARCQFSQSRMI